MRNANLYDAIDGNCCTGCSGKGFNWIEPMQPGASYRRIKTCDDCGGYGYFRQDIRFSRVLAVIATATALIAFIVIPLIRMLI